MTPESRFSVAFEQFDREQVSQKRRRKIMVDLLTSMTYLTFCVFLMAYFMRTIQEYLIPHVSQLVDSIPTINYFADSLSAPLISDLQPVAIDEACPDDFIKIPIGLWPGTSKGCYCSKTQTYAASPDCNSSCQEVPVTPQIPLYIWQESHLCAKFNSKYMLSPARICLPDFKLCGLYLCVPAAEDCPITEVRIGTKDLPEYQSRALSTGNLILFKRNASSTSHLRSLGAYLNGGPCLNPVRSHGRNGSEPFPFLNLTETGCDKYDIDNDTSVLDFEDELEFYQQNGLVEQALKYFSNYEEFTKNQKMVLSAIYRPKLAVLTSRPQKIGPCLTIDSQIIRTYGENIHDFAKVLENYSNFFFPLAGILITIGNFYAIYVMVKITCYLSGSRGFFSKIEVVWKWITIFSTLGILIFYVTSGRNLENGAEELIKLQNYFLEVSHKDCFLDHALNLMLKDFSDLIVETLTNNLKTVRDVRKIVFALTPFILVGFLVGVVLGCQIPKPQLIDDEDEDEEPLHGNQTKEAQTGIQLNPLTHSLTDIRKKSLEL